MTKLVDWQKVREDFLFSHIKVYGKPLIYFDNAATAQKPRVVLEAMTRYYEDYCSNVNRGLHYLSGIATKKYEEARKIVANFIGAASEGEIVFTRSTTESINLVAHGLSKIHFSPGDEIVLTEMEHHANIVPWYLLAKDKGVLLRIARVQDDGTLDVAHFQSLFNARTKLAAFVHASNALGTINPVKELIDIAKIHSVPTLVDGAQAVPHIPVDVSSLDVDFYAFSGHKVYGPTGIGVLYAKRPWLDTLPPYQGGGDMISSVSFENITFADAPQKFEAGTPNVAGALGLASALQYVSGLGLLAIKERECELHAYLLRRLNEIPGLSVVGQANEQVSLSSFVLKGVHPHDLSSILDREGIAIRAGHLCTEPLVKRFGQSAFSRVSLAFYNTHEEIDRFIAAFSTVKELFRL
ncbi:MAG TPA: cysteine desulfurase [Myxococcota bacterium]|nr:cysteine desulfurase [Myxococcota bacterium]